MRGKENFTERDTLDNALLLYGTGDGGGGPGEVHIELLKRQQQNFRGFPSIRFGKAIDFFERLKLSREKLKSYKGELYLEKHQGTYTTQARNKFYNRKIEFLLHDVEMLASAAYLRGYAYPHVFLEQIWKEVLLYQFHDILPGSSIKRVYDESCTRYSAMMEQLQAEKDRILSFLSEGEGKCFINTSSFDRAEYIKSGEGWFRAEAKAYSSSPLMELDDADMQFNLSFGERFIENEQLKLEFSSEGYITSLFDKVNGIECCGEYLNRLTLYTDKWMFFNAWDIDINYKQKHNFFLRLIKHETFTDGPRVIRRHYYKHKRTVLSQDIILTAGKSLIEFDTTCDYHETFKMLRADFAPSINSDKVSCDIQFGSFDRSTKNDTSVERAQFEICAHKWVDLSDENYGISLINDSKYGHMAKEGILSLNLLRSPIYPDSRADRGSHHFKYALYPHKGSLAQAGTIKESYAFNMTQLVHEGLVSLMPLISVDSKNIIVETVKKAENSESIIIRAYECFGHDTAARLSTAFEYKEAFECDMLENSIRKSNPEQLQFSPFEIKTLLFSL